MVDLAELFRDVETYRQRTHRIAFDDRGDVGTLNDGLIVQEVLAVEKDLKRAGVDAKAAVEDGVGRIDVVRIDRKSVV